MASSTHSEPSTVSILITHKVAADFEARDVFPELRPEHSLRAAGATGHYHEITRSFARRLVEDCIEHGVIKRTAAGGSLTKAYSALLDNLGNRFGWYTNYYFRRGMRAPTEAELEAQYTATAAAMEKLGLPVLPRGEHP